MLKNKFSLVFLIGLLALGVFLVQKNKKPATDTATTTPATEQDSSGDYKTVEVPKKQDSNLIRKCGPDDTLSFCRIFNVPKEEDFGVTVEKGRIIVKREARNYYQQAKVLLSPNDKVLDIWTLALGQFLQESVLHEHLATAGGYGYLIYLVIEEDGKVKDSFVAVLHPNQLEELLEVYKDAIPKISGDPNSPLLEELQKKFVFRVVTENFVNYYTMQRPEAKSP